MRCAVMPRMAWSLTMPPRKTTTKETMSIRLDDAQRSRLAALAARMGEVAGGVDLPVSLAMRTALDRGMTVLEDELGLKARTRR